MVTNDAINNTKSATAKKYLYFGYFIYLRIRLRFFNLQLNVINFIKIICDFLPLNLPAKNKLSSRLIKIVNPNPNLQSLIENVKQ